MIEENVKESKAFDELKMAYVTEYRDIQAVVFDTALAEGKSA